MWLTTPFAVKINTMWLMWRLNDPAFVSSPLTFPCTSGFQNLPSVFPGPPWHSLEETHLQVNRSTRAERSGDADSRTEDKPTFHRKGCQGEASHRTSPAAEGPRPRAWVGAAPSWGARGVGMHAHVQRSHTSQRCFAAKIKEKEICFFLNFRPFNICLLG